MSSSAVASSSRRSPALQVVHRPPAGLVEALAAARDPALATDDIWQDVTEAALECLLSLSRGLPPPRTTYEPTAKGKEKALDDGMVHWYCGAGGAEQCWESAVFLTRLLSFKAEGEVGEWRALYEQLMLFCSECVRDFECAKNQFTTNYLTQLKGARMAEIFLDRLNERELVSTIKFIQDARFHDLADFPPAVVQHCLVNSRLFQNSTIQSLITSGLPLKTPLPLSTSVSPGLVGYLFDSSRILREWAQSQLALCESATRTHYARAGLGRIYHAAILVIYRRDRGEVHEDSGLAIKWTDDRRTYWHSFALALSLLSPEALKDNLLKNGHDVLDSGTDVAQIVTSHLDDTDDHFEFILSAFRVLLDSLGHAFWVRDEDDKYEEVILHAVLDNPTFEEAFVQLSSSSPDQPYLDWLPPFLASVASSRELFRRAMAIVASTFLDRFQKARFDPGPRTLAIQLAVTVFAQVLLEHSPKATSSSVFEPIITMWPHSLEALKVLELHASIFAQLAFAPVYAGPEWSTAREAATAFFAQISLADSKRLTDSVYCLAEFSNRSKAFESKRKRLAEQIARGEIGPDALTTMGPAPTSPLPLTIASAVWERSYELIKTSDITGIAALVVATSHSAHLEMLSSRSWSLKNYIRPQMKAVNVGMEVTRNPLLPILEGLTDERTDLLFDFLALPNVAESISTILFSPIEKIHNTAQGVITQAFDVTTRRECFRSLLFQHPEATLRGIGRAVKAFVRAARSLPEACGMAKRIVRCLSDVIDVFCATRDGLLRDSGFVARGGEANLRVKLMSLWRSMCESLALLFKRTPEWATYFENDQMTEWMRDAIIFGGDLLDQLSTFEKVISGHSLSAGPLASPSKLSSAGQRMITALNDPLEDLIAWLRLNDEDLLSSSFELVCRMLERFTRSGISIRQSTTDKIKKITERNAKRKDPSIPRSSILRDDQLRELLASLEGQRQDLPAEDSTTETKAPRTKMVASKGRIEVIQIDDEDVTTRGPKASLVSKPSVAKPFGSINRLQSTTRPPSGFQKGASKSAPPIRARGVPWTQYTSKPRDESSDSSSDEEPQKGKLVGLAALANAQKPATIRKPEERRSVKLYNALGDDHRNNKAFPRQEFERQQAAASAARLRGVQEFSDLYRDILQWDVSHDTPLPPSMIQDPPRIPSSFRSAEAYAAAFLPLLLMECWAQICQAVAENTKESAPVPCQIAGRQAVDDFTEIFATIENAKLPDRMWYGDSDLVLLRQGQRQTLAKVQSFSRRRDGIDLTFRCHLGTDISHAAGALVPLSKWNIIKLCTMSTIHREYSALQTLRYLELASAILDPVPPPRIQQDARTVQRTMASYQVNEPQALAILNSLQTRGFSLIQGPPGTGKTKTILGLIGAFVDSRPRAATSISVGRASTPQPQVGTVAKILLCAPSNAAVDEVAKRLKEGIRDSAGHLFVPKVVRIGSDASVDISVKDIFIDELVEREISGATGATSGDTSQAQMAQMRSEIDGLRTERDMKKAEQEDLDKNSARKTELAQEIRAIRSKINDLSQRLDSEKDKAQQVRRAQDAQQRKVRMQILSDADVICATLSGSGHDYMAQLPFDFETVIIDEAAQSIELSSLIPLKYGCRRCILVGDPLQLPPTVISPRAGTAGYQRSLFVRMMERGPSSVHLLSIQYRMHSHISAFPSAAFYQRRLTDGPGMDEKTAQPWHTNPLFPPYGFFHVRHGTEVAGRYHSWTNPTEAGVAVSLYERLATEFSQLDLAYRVGIVTPYKGQVEELKRQFRLKFGFDILSKVSFNTVDGFQGQEKDIIILSCVRGGSEERTVGFLKDTRRMNVALTRARSSLFVLGDKNKLRTNEYWKNLVDDAEARGLLREVDASTYRSTGRVAPPVVARAAVAPGKSKAASIPPPADLQTPAALAAKSRLPSGSVGSIKRRLSDVIGSAPSPPEKKPKKEDSPSLVISSVTAEAHKSAAVAPGPAFQPPKPPVVMRKRPPPSLFMPSKKRPPTQTGAPKPPVRK